MSDTLFRSILRLPLRQTQGFVKSILKRLRLSPSVPDYTTLSRRSKTLALKIKSFKKVDFAQPVHILIDSTGLSVYSGAYFHRSRYNEARKLKDGKAWKKLHIAYDPSSFEVTSAYLSDSTMTDAAAMERLAALPGRKVGRITADGAYDRSSCYRAAHALSAQAIIPPMRTAKAQTKRTRGHPYEEALATRDQAINFIKQYPTHEEGLKAWKQQNGYHKRSKESVAQSLVSDTRDRSIFLASGLCGGV